MVLSMLLLFPLLFYFFCQMTKNCHVSVTHADRERTFQMIIISNFLLIMMKMMWPVSYFYFHTFTFIHSLSHWPCGLRKCIHSYPGRPCRSTTATIVIAFCTYDGNYGNHDVASCIPSYQIYGWGNKISLSKIQLDAADSGGRTALHVACSEGNFID